MSICTERKIVAHVASKGGKAAFLTWLSELALLASLLKWNYMIYVQQSSKVKAPVKVRPRAGVLAGVGIYVCF